ncbi:MAG: hypothetical protein ACTHKL_08580 [Streptosporangiaceae bacterium]
MARIGIRALAFAAAIGVLAAAAPALAGTPRLATGKYANISVRRAVMTMAEGITDFGLIVGCFQRKTGPERGFADRHGQFAFITHPSGAGVSAVTCPLAANGGGAIVGYYQNKAGVLHGFVYRKGAFTTIDDPSAGKMSGQGTVAVGINKSGVIVGWYIDADNAEHGFELSSSAFTTVDEPAAAGTAAGGTVVNGVADDGTMSGAYTDDQGRQHGFWLRGGTFHRIDVPGARNTAVACISALSGLLVGVYRVSGHRRPSGFSYHHGVFRTLADPSATMGTDPQCANDRSRVVGFYVRDQKLTGFRFTPGAARAAAREVEPGAGSGRLPASPRLGQI